MEICVITGVTELKFILISPDPPLNTLMLFILGEGWLLDQEQKPLDLDNSNM